MPRDGSGNYTLPYPPVVDATTIESAVHNGTMSDIALQLNGPVPIIAGGTGANNAAGAMVNLKGEVALQQVTNFDTHPFVAGSFWCSTGTTAAPNAGFWLGICYVHGADPNVIYLEARQYSGSLAIGPKNVRHKVSGSGWTAWEQQISSAADLDARYVNLTGDTMTGSLNGTVAVFSGEVHAGSLWTQGWAGVPAQGILFWGDTGTKYTFWDGTAYQFYGGAVTISSTTASSSSTTGALTVAGGVGVAGQIVGGGAVYSTGQLGPLLPNSFVMDVSGGISRLMSFGPNASTVGSIICNLYSSNASVSAPVWGANATTMTVNYTTASSSPTTGALTVVGGIGANARSYFTDINVTSSIAAGSIAVTGITNLGGQVLISGGPTVTPNIIRAGALIDVAAGRGYSLGIASGVDVSTGVTDVLYNFFFSTATANCPVASVYGTSVNAACNLANSGTGSVRIHCIIATTAALIDPIYYTFHATGS